MNDNYTSIKLPTAFVEQYIDTIVDAAADGFKSRAEVIKSALREFKDRFKGATPNATP
jgi:Arc/MetJ-type ribon-helix-helix transcriptional regulator